MVTISLLLKQALNLRLEPIMAFNIHIVVFSRDSSVGMVTRLRLE